MEINGYSKCECGAITIFTTQGNYSCKLKNLKKYFPNINLRKLKKYQTSYCCDHCVNHYGLDLCGCGSGEDFGECDNNLEECQKPMQIIGEYNCIKAINAWG